MKMKKIFAIITILSFIFILSSCNNNHEHQFSEEYGYNETQHWFVATCEHADEKGQVESHNFSEWTVKVQKTCTEDEVLKRFCLTCFYEETKTGESSGHNLEDVSSKNATCLVDGVKSHKHCTICNKNFDENGNELTSVIIGKLQHSLLDEWQYDETNHYKVCVNGCTNFYETETHSFVDHAEVPASCNTTGIIAYKECSVCHAKYDLENNYLASEEDLILPTKGHSFSTDWVYDETHHWHTATCEHITEISNKVEHLYDSISGVCICGKKLSLTLLGNHEGTAQWDMTNEEKISSNAVIHQNVSNIAVDAAGNLLDFSLQIQYKGWENNSELGYYFTISSTDGALAIVNKLGIDPWTPTTIKLSDEHKLRLASEKGLDFIVKYDHAEQKLYLYLYTNHELVLLHEMNTYYGSMANFYKFRYVLTGTATVNTTTYNSYNTSIEDVCAELEITNHEHNVLNVLSYDEYSHWNPCDGCDQKHNEVEHDFDVTTGQCVCGESKEIVKEETLTLLGSHEGTDLWEMANEEKISSNAVIHQNVSNVAVDADGNLVDFSLQIQYRGWENNGERTYFFTIKSVNGVLTIDNQLGIDPWEYTTFTLSDEHKERLATAEGLDFFVCYNHSNQKLSLYIVTNDEVVKLYEMNTYYGSMANFYKFKYVLTGTATVQTTTYKVSEGFEPHSDLLNK